MTPLAARTADFIDDRRPTLAFLASVAALEFDRRLRQPLAPPVEVTSLVNELQYTIQPLGGGDTRAGLVDPTAAGVLCRALIGFIPSPPTSVNKLRECAQEFVDRLSKALSVDDPNELERLRDFCLAVSQSAQLEMPDTFVGVEYPEFGS